MERIRQEVPASFGPDDIARQGEQGWKLVAVEWERETAGSRKQHARQPKKSPSACKSPKRPARLEENPTEQEVLFLMMELTIQDGPYSVIADELNRRGYRTRQGMKWTPISVFQMLPRLIEVGPRIFATQEWQERRARLAKMAAG